MAEKNKDQQPTGGVVTEQQAKQMKSTFGEFNAEEIKKESQQTPVTTIYKSMIHHGLVKLYNQKVRKKTEKPATTINYERFLQVCESFKVPDEVKLAYTNRKAAFTSQSDDLILYFSSLKPTQMGEISHKEKRMIITEAIESVMFDMYEVVDMMTPSKVSVGHMTLVAPINAVELGINPMRDRLSNVNVKAVDYLFDSLAQKAKKKA